MKRHTRLLIIAAAVLLCLVAAALFALNSYVQSEAGRAKIEAELAKALDVPLEIQHASLTWNGIRLTGPRITVNDQPFLEATAFTTEYRLLPLFQRQVVLHKMIIQDPRIIWPQNSEGKWVWPRRPKEEKPPETAPAEPKVVKPKGFHLALDTLEVKNGSIEMLDQKGQRFVYAPSVQGKVYLGVAKEASGEATAATLALLQNGPVLEKVRIPFQVAAEKVTFNKFSAMLGGGSVEGTLAVDGKEKDSPFDLQLALEDVDLARAITDPEWKIRSGRLSAALDLRGSSREAQRGEGRGEIHVSQATVDALEPILRLIGETCHIPEFANLRLSLQTNLLSFAQILGIPDTVTLQKMDTVFAMGEKETTIEQFTVDAGELGVGAKGVIGKDGKLNLEANLNVSEILSRKLPSLVRDSLAMDGKGRRGVDFHITGKSDRPKTDLVDKLIGSKIGDQFNDIVSSIFGPRKDKGERDKEKEREKAEKAEKKEQKKKEKETKEAKAPPKPGETSATGPGAPATTPTAPPERGAPPTPTAPQPGQ